MATRLATDADAFTPGVEIDDGLVPARRFVPFLPEFHSVATGDDGTIYVSWADARHGDEDVFLVRSNDDARTWSQPQRITTDEVGAGAPQRLPAVDVAPNGRVDVLFLDGHRNPDTTLVEARLAVSYDGASTFTDVPVSSQTFDTTVGPIHGSTVRPELAQSLEPDLGTGLGLASRGDAVVAAWVDTRLSDADTGRQEVFGTHTAMPDRDGLHLRRNLVIAGLVAAGLLLWWSRRRARAPSGDPT